MSLLALNPLRLMAAMPGNIAQGIIWGIMAVGVYMTFRLLNFADLTVDGSFTTGGATAVMLITGGVPAWAALLLAFLVGMVTGLATGLLHTKLGIPEILAGILTQIALYSINLRIMGGKANQVVSVDKYHLVVTMRKIPLAILSGGIICFAIICIMYWFFGTEIGSGIRATGCNPNMAKAQGINVGSMKVLTLALSNGLVALAGGLLAQYQGFADINMGRGSIVVGLAAVIIGETLGEAIFGRRLNFMGHLLFVAIGGVIYYIVIGFVLWLKMPANDLKLFTAIVVAIFLAVPYLQAKSRNSFAKAAKKGLSEMANAPLMLELNHIRKTFNKGTINEKPALLGVTLKLNPGDFCTVIGGNGAGKSTCLNAIAGVWPVDGGSIIVDGENITGLPEYKRAEFLGRVFQDPMNGTAATMQIDENLALAARRGNRRGLGWGITKQEHEIYHEQLKTLELGLEDRMTQKVGLLSGGQRQALTLLMATLKKPKLLLLDEHTAALDPKTAEKVLHLTDEIVKRDSLTALMVTHNMRDAIRMGNRLIMMNEGRIVYEVSGEEKKHLQVSDLLEKFSDVSHGQFANDRMMLA